ncbi:glycoside hydrolase family 16 protein [Amnibacterium sp.]|uniref:glycoside hydrolase family 16 protein n=1 Tax=Amnibacterium sp. TaxID=1872496 RepID=UPI003F7B5A9A
MRRHPVRSAGIAVLACLGLVLSTLIAGGAEGLGQAVVCDEKGTVCTRLLASDASPQWAILPLSADGRLLIRNDDRTGSVVIGVVAYLRADASPIGPAGSTTGSVTVAPRASEALELRGAPGGARLVLVRTGRGVAGGVSCTGPDCAGLRVVARGSASVPPTDVLTRLIAERRGVPTAAARIVAEAVVKRVGAEGPAHLTAAVRPGRGRLTVDWELAPGGQDVVAVRVTLIRAGGTAPIQEHDAIAASGSLVLTGLATTTPYTVDVAPVVRSKGTEVVGAAVQLPATADGAPVAAGATRPSAPAGWTPLLEQDFATPAPLGSFAAVYPGWSWYDGMTETSRETARPRGQVGVWNSATTMSVSNGMLDCHLHTAGEQPQVCALTPTPDGQQWHGQLYGRYSVRFRADAVPGFKIAWLLWPDSDQWNQGEIDFPEGSLDGPITGSSHRTDGDPADFAWFVDTGTRMQAWHTATIDWEPGRLTFLLDGQSWTTTDPLALPRVPMRWALQAETEIIDTPPARSAQGDILIDWVAAWSRSS